MGIAFGGGSASSVFGGSGAGNFLTRLTVVAAFGFMLTSMTLAYFSSNQGADPLQQLSAESIEAAEQREQERQEIIAPDSPDDGAVTDEGAMEDGAMENGIEGEDAPTLSIPADPSELPATGDDTGAGAAEPGGATAEPGGATAEPGGATAEPGGAEDAPPPNPAAE